MSQLSHIQDDNQWIFYVAEAVNKASLSQPSVNWFKVEQLPSDFSITGQATGRGTTWFLRCQSNEYVLRHYKRGGAIANVSDDKFLYLGMQQTRPVKELSLLIKLQHWQLPAPKPIAGLVSRHGLTWQGDLITARIDGAQDVHNVLMQRSLSKLEWRHIGSTIVRFHQRQVFHHDLNIHNIMLDAKGQAWLIDFDKCGIKSGNRWKQANLQRLLRSLQKEANNYSNYGFKHENWRSLIEGYHSIGA